MKETSTTVPMLPRRYVVLGVIAILALAAFVLWTLYLPGYGAGVDEASYLLGAKGIATHGDPGFHNPDPTLFVPENMIEPRAGVFYPTYPVGYPMLAAAGYWLGGPAGGFVVNPVLTLVALVGVFFLARLFLEDLFALAVMLVMAAHPTVMHYGVTAMSHASDLAFSTWCLYFAFDWYRKPRVYKLCVAGFLAGFAVSIRYTEALLALPLMYVVALRFWEAWRGGASVSMRRVVLHGGAGAAAGLVGVLPLLWFHAHAFGSPFTTGYSFTGVSRAFSWDFFRAHFPFALKTLCTMPTGLFIFFPLGLAALFVRRWLPVKKSVFLALAFVPTLLLYGAYYWINTAEPIMYVRFFLTLFPVVLIAALTPADVLSRRKPAVRWGIAGLVLIFAIVNLAQTPDENRIEGTAFSDLAGTRLAQRNLPPDAVIVANGYMSFSLIYYTDMTVIYPLYFSQEWVQDRVTTVHGGGAGGTSDFNPLRMRRFADALGGRSQTELYALLEQKLLAYAKSGRTVALLTHDDDPPWFNYLDRSFVHEGVARDEREHLLLFRLRPR